ncbi:hypothetical protein OOK39_03595 [Streptomyces sp. NBC_00264]|uniref:DUF6630 family protein n=1 Tax=unclassified Streptomyces TaxID=2593676 RepID=UPI00224D84CB|nr:MULTISPECIES: DUF6630 family protein [unclassified Streptomyces]MCX5158381.1 hypothetical protein [Streptomyces sp. NBC_00305]MCX5216904.1 hypothetical protein [Streptomyces sp. NBC_00264]
MSGTETVRMSLEAMASLLAPAHPDVVEQVLHAHDDPEGYVRTHAEQLGERCIHEPVAELAWIALVDALFDHQLLAEFDWKEDPQEIRAQLRMLASRPAVDPWVLFEADEMSLPAHEFLTACGRHYRDVGAALAVLDIESDCYPVVCLRAAQVDELTELAGRAGYTARGLGN